MPLHRLACKRPTWTTCSIPHHSNENILTALYIYGEKVELHNWVRWIFVGYGSRHSGYSELRETGYCRLRFHNSLELFSFLFPSQKFFIRHINFITISFQVPTHKCLREQYKRNWNQTWLTSLTLEKYYQRIMIHQLLYFEWRSTWVLYK